MNKVYKVIYSKARQCYIVVSELARNHHKSVSSNGAVVGSNKLSRLLVAALAAGTLTWGILPSDTFAADPAIVTDAKGNILSTDAKTKDEIAEDSDSFPQGSGQSIAIGKDAYAFMQGGSKAQMMLFGEKKATGSIAIGEGAQALSQAIAIGNRVYTGDLGDVTLSKYNNALSGAGVGSVLLGSNSYTGGTLSTLMGDYSIMSTSYPNGNSAAYTQNAGAVSIGALNSIESATSTNPTSGIADSIVGLANRTQNANGALVYGAGNEITNSIATAAAPSFASSAKKAANDLRESVKNNPGGAALAIGGGNKIDRSIRTQVMGVNNEVTGSLYHEDAQYIDIFGHKFETSPEVNEYSSQYNMVDGYNNKVSNTNNAYVIGTNNTILGKTFSADTKDGTLSKADRTKAKESDNLVIIGDNHTMGKDVKNNIVIGTSDKALTTSVSNAVLLGHNADVQNDGGVAVGDSSVASTDKGAVGYDLKGEDHSSDTTGTWKSTAAAVSVGDTTKNLTRQITGVAAGSSDTDAVNVAQLKKAISSAAGTVKDTRNTVKAGENVTLDTKGNDDSGYEYTVNVKADGKVASGDTKLISGDTVYNETRVQQDGTYVKKDKTAGENLTALDNQVANNTQNITNVNGRVNDLDSKVNKVGAGAAALAALHPLDFDPDDKWDFAVGYGNYRDANSVAVGAFYRPDEDTMFSLGTNFGNGENMINAGISFKFGQKGKTSNNRLVINKEVTELRATVSRQDEQLKKQDSEIKELKAMVSKLLADKENKAEAAK